MIDFRQFIFIWSTLLGGAVYEYTHVYSEFKLGSTIARMRGGPLLNPLSHMDSIYLFNMLLFRHGWTRGVTFDFGNISNLEKNRLFFSQTGTIINLTMVILALFFLSMIPNNFNLIEILVFNLSLINLMIAVIYLLPLHPIDGSKILFFFSPLRTQIKKYDNEKYLYFILLVIILIGITGSKLGFILNYSLEGLY